MNSICVVVLLVSLLTGCGGGGGSAASGSSAAASSSAGASAPQPSPTAAGTTASPSPQPSASPAATPTPSPATSPSPQGNDLVFVPDSGLREDNAANAAAGVDPATSIVYLYYQNLLTHQNVRSQSTDGLTFAAGTVPADFRFDSRNTRMPDGTWRRYQHDLNVPAVTSSASGNGVDFTAEAGVRYSLVAADNGEFGVYDAYLDTAGGVVFIYLGDLHGKNNCRLARSTDNGVTFTFVRGNVLGDDSAGGGANAFVDVKTTALPDGRLRLFCMRQGTIYSFVSDAARTSFTQESGTRLRPSDFTELSISAFYDPVVIRLPDGRYRMYVTAQIGTRQALVSASTQ